LSIAQRMAALLGHPLGLRSWPGRGSVFHLDVPRARAAPASTAMAAATQNVTAGRALVLDNEPAARTALASLLQGWGWEVHVAAQPRQALETPWRPDLCVLDYHLDHGATGLDVLRELRRAYPGVPALVLTADRDGELRQRVLEAGAMVLHKPLKPLAMQQVMQRLMAAARGGAPA
jgi:CheY-like chemotaxis protein